MRQRILFGIFVALISSGCQKKASGQTVAVVNNEEITAGELNDALSKNAPAGATNTKEARAAVLQQLIDRKLLVQQARSDGLDKSPEFINQQRRGTEDLLINMLVSRKVNASPLPSSDEVNRYEAAHPGIFANRELWTLSQIVYPLPVDSAVTTKITAAKTLDEVAQVLTASGIQFTRASRQIDSAVLPPTIYAQISRLREGEPFIAPGPGKAVASVITARQSQPLSGDQARQIALQSVRRDNAGKFVQDRIKELKAKAKIEYQPGFAPPKS
jgi:peptidyl-prolyl cis-trans isomerase C